MRLTLSTCLLAGLAASMLGCQSRSADPLDPAGAVHPVPDSTAPVWINGDRTEGMAGLWRVTVDSDALTGTLLPLDNRTAAANDDVYDLSIQNFTRPDSLRIRSVRRDAGQLLLDWQFTHPFAAPSNLAGPATAANRADLGVSGRLIFLIDVPTATGNTWFADDRPAIVNTAVVANPHGYFKPDGALPGLTTIANTFPYQVLVDETGNGSRVGISNGGQPTGNYSDAAGGWQQSNIGPGNNGWTGYGVLHQGQATAGTLALDLAAITGSPFTFDTTIFCAYNDPRMGANAQQKRANRLPKNPVDVFAFAYRMPHGTQDIERITFLGDSGSGLVANEPSNTMLNFHIVDWDARGFETTFGDLAADPLVSTVAAGESGPPSLRIDIFDGSGMLTGLFDPTSLQDDDSAFPNGDVGIDLGYPGDALYYACAFTNTGISGQVSGLQNAMVRVVDAEATADTSAWRFVLQPDLSPVTVNRPFPEAYQSFTVNFADLTNQPPVATFSLVNSSIFDGGTVTLRADTYSDPESDQIEVFIDWNNDGDFNDPGESGNYLNGAGGPPVNFISPITYIWSGSNPDNRTLPVQYKDTDNPPTTVVPALTFTVLEPGNCGGPWLSPATFATAWASAPFFNHNFADMASSQTTMDYAAFRTVNLAVPAAGTPAGWACQRITNAPVGYQIHRIYPAGATVASGLNSIQLTNAPAALGSDSLTGRRVHQIVTDSLNRVLFARFDPGVLPTGLTGPNNVSNGVYNVAGTGFVWFDTDGGSSMVTDAGMNTVATANRVVALAIGEDNDLFLIDNQNVLRRYVRASGYTESTAAPFPLDLKAAPYSMTLGTRYVHEFDISLYNGAFFILTEDTSGIERVYRIECDGQLISPVPSTTNPNPMTVQVFDFLSDILTRPLGLFIDQYDTSGALLGSASDAQIILGGYVTNGTDLNKVRIMTTQLTYTGGTNASVPYRSVADVRNNWLLTSSGSGTRTYRMWESAPGGWQ